MKTKKFTEKNNSFITKGKKMSANLNEGRMFYTGNKPWHNEGIKLNNPATAKEAISAARLDYKVEKKEVFTDKGIIPNIKATVRSDTGDTFGIVTDVYKIVQNVEAFDFFDNVVGDGKAIYHTAGALGKGERIWILAKLPGDILVTRDDVVEKYLVLTNSHDGKSALRMYYTPVRVVCQNTLTQSLAHAGSGISIRHSGAVTSKLNEARRVLGLAVNYYMTFADNLKALAQYKMSEAELDAYFNFALRGNVIIEKDDISTRLKNEKEQLRALFVRGKGNGAIDVKDTLWAGYNAVTEYVDHYKTVKKEEDNRIQSIIFGNGANIKGRALTKALELVKA